VPPISDHEAAARLFSEHSVPKPFVGSRLAVRYPACSLPRHRRKDPTVAKAFRIPTLIVALLLPALGHAQLFRAYLASDGLDTNPCSLLQPCRLLPAALAAVASGGEIWMLDSANYNTAEVNVAKSVTIQAVPGAIGSVVLTTGNAFSINTPDIRVTLRNLVIAPLSAGSGIDGMLIGAGAAGATIHVESCQIARVPFNMGIRVLGNATLHVLDTVLRDNWYGILVGNGTTTISRSQVIGNSNIGVYVTTGDPARNPVVHIDNSALSKNNYGLAVVTTAGGVGRAFVARSVLSANTYHGVQVGTDASVTDAFLEISESVANGNGSYGMANFGGTLRSAGDNRAEGNGSGATTGTITLTASH
jgi:hypothetical protein